MEQPKNKYILLNHRVGYTVERNMFGLSTKPLPTNVLRGELLEALPEAEQPQDCLTRVALAGIDRKSLRIECSMEDLTRLTDEDAKLLLAISSSESRYQTLIDRKRLDFGRRLSPDSQVFVSVKGIPKDVVGVVWYKGELPSLPGTMFGVELIVSTPKTAHKTILSNFIDQKPVYSNQKLSLFYYMAGSQVGKVK